MRSIFMLARALLALSLAGCGTLNVPVWDRDMQQLDKLGKGITVAEVDKVFGRSTILASKTAEIDGTPYLFRHYQSIESTAYRTQMACRNGNCMTNRNPEHKMEPYAVVFAGPEPRLHAWGTLAQLRKSTDPEVVAVMRKLDSSYSDYLLKR